MKSRLSLLAALGALLGAQEWAAAAPPAASPAPPSRPLAEVPASDSTLSLFEAREGQCQWLRMDPSAQKTAVVASFEGECKGVRLSWDKDLGRALVWFDPQWVRPYRGALFDDIPAGHPREEPTPGATPRLYEVTVASGQVRPLPFPSVQGDVEDIGYNGERITALSVRHLTDEEKEKTSLTVEGKRFALGTGDKKAPALLFAYQLSGTGPWKNVAAEVASRVYDREISASALGDIATLGTSAADMLSPHPGDGESLTEEQEHPLLPLLPAPMAEKARKGEPPARGRWFHGTTPAGSFDVWSISAHGLYTTGHLVLEVKGKPRVAKDLGFTASDFVAVRTRGPFILVASDRVGAFPRLYDARTGQLVFRSDTARSTTLWPTPAP